MATNDPSTAVRTAQAELDAIMNRIQVSLAQKEALVRSWTAKSKATDIEPRKTNAELDAEDALLFRAEPPYLGVGCPIPENFMISEADRSKKTLEAKFWKGLQASKRRDAEEKAESAKRALRDDSSDEEGGRSSLGKKKKKLKIVPPEEPVKQVEEAKTPEKVLRSKIAAAQEPKRVEEVKEDIVAKKVKVDTKEASKKSEQDEKASETMEESLATPPATPEMMIDNQSTKFRKAEEATTDQIQGREEEGEGSPEGGEEKAQAIGGGRAKYLKQEKFGMKKLKRKLVRGEGKKENRL